MVRSAGGSSSTESVHYWLLREEEGHLTSPVSTSASAGEHLLMLEASARGGAATFSSRTNLYTLLPLRSKKGRQVIFKVFFLHIY